MEVLLHGLYFHCVEFANTTNFPSFPYNRSSPSVCFGQDNVDEVLGLGHDQNPLETVTSHLGAKGRLTLAIYCSP